MRSLRRQPDDRGLAVRIRDGDEAAFEALYDRHHASLLAFCRHMLGNREDGEDALQQTFVRAHGSLRKGRLPDSVRSWLFAIARNRCLTMLAARRDTVVAPEDFEPGYDGLAEEVRRRADLRELVSDLARVPDDQRAALVLFELGGFEQAEIASVLGCAPGKVKALVFQARSALIADREARETPCEQIRGELELARAGALRRGPLRRHLRQCGSCDDYRRIVARQRGGLALILPVAPSAGLKIAVLGGAGASGSAGAAAAGALSAGAAGGLVAKGVVAKVAITVAVAGAGVSGGVATVGGGGASGDPGPVADRSQPVLEPARETGPPPPAGRGSSAPDVAAPADRGPRRLRASTSAPGEDPLALRLSGADEERRALRPRRIRRLAALPGANRPRRAVRLVRRRVAARRGRSPAAADQARDPALAAGCAGAAAHVRGGSGAAAAARPARHQAWPSAPGRPGSRPRARAPATCASARAAPGATPGA